MDIKDGLSERLIKSIPLERRTYIPSDLIMDNDFSIWRGVIAWEIYSRLGTGNDIVIISLRDIINNCGRSVLTINLMPMLIKDLRALEQKGYVRMVHNQHYYYELDVNRDKIKSGNKMLCVFTDEVYKIMNIKPDESYDIPFTLWFLMYIRANLFDRKVMYPTDYIHDYNLKSPNSMLTYRSEIARLMNVNHSSKLQSALKMLRERGMFIHTTVSNIAVNYYIDDDGYKFVAPFLITEMYHREINYDGVMVESIRGKKYWEEEQHNALVNLKNTGYVSYYRYRYLGDKTQLKIKRKK